MKKSTVRHKPSPAVSLSALLDSLLRAGANTEAGVTIKELAAHRGFPEPTESRLRSMRADMARLVAKGQVKVTTVRRPSICGRVTTVPAYTIAKKSGK